MKYLNLEGNEIEFLPGNLFEHVKNIEHIWLNSNKTKFIEPNLLDDLPKLKSISLEGNVNINKRHDSRYNGILGHTTLEGIIKEIREKCKPDLNYLRVLSETEEQFI